MEYLAVPFLWPSKVPGCAAEKDLLNFRRSGRIELQNTRDLTDKFEFPAIPLFFDYFTQNFLK